MIRKTSLACVFALMLGASAKAETLNAVTFVQGAGAVTANADGSYRLQTSSSSDKAMVTFVRSGLAQLGTLGDVQGFTADFLKSAAGASPSHHMAIRFLTNTGGTQGLVWENSYNGNAAVPLDQWQTYDFLHPDTDTFWQRGSNGLSNSNFDQVANMRPFADWASATGFKPSGSVTTFDANTPIYGIQVSYGSGVAGTFDGSFRDITLTLQGGAEYTAAGEPVPLPSTAMMAAACAAALGLIGRGRRRTAAMA